ncbi:phasin family protein, partial [Escherichia coli]
MDRRDREILAADLAGCLGAYSKVSKDGSKLFETLVKDGEKAEKEA